MATRDTEYSGFQIVETPQIITILFESSPYSTYRIIYMDGRQHPNDLDTSYMGHSIGHWEGDTLVVDVVGLNDETWLGGGFTGFKNAKIHSDKEHVIERISRNGDVMTYEATVEDPVMFTKPWVVYSQARSTRRARRRNTRNHLRGQGQGTHHHADRKGWIFL